MHTNNLCCIELWVQIPSETLAEWDLFMPLIVYGMSLFLEDRKVVQSAHELLRALWFGEDPVFIFIYLRQGFLCVAALGFGKADLYWGPWLSIFGSWDDRSSFSVKVIGPGRVGIDYISSLAVLRPAEATTKLTCVYEYFIRLPPWNSWVSIRGTAGVSSWHALILTVTQQATFELPASVQILERPHLRSPWYRGTEMRDIHCNCKRKRPVRCVASAVGTAKQWQQSEGRMRFR